MTDVEPARREDLPQLVRLIGSVEGCAPATVWSVPWDVDDYWVIRDGPEVVAAGALQPVGDEGRQAEIRGLAVDPRYRGYGLASRLVQHLCALGSRAGLDVVCITRKPRFFERQGFALTRSDWLPPYRVDPEHAGDTPRVALVRPSLGQAA